MGISLTVLDAGNCFKAVVIYSFANRMSEPELTEKLNNILLSEDLLQKQYAKTHLFWSFPESILVPSELMNAGSENEMLSLVYGYAGKGIIKNDFLYKYNLHNIYRIPWSIQECFTNKFPYATQTHHYSALMNRELKDGDHLYSIFYSNSLTLMLYKEAKLQVVQHFEYSNPDDTAYHLLNVCKSFDVPADSVTLHISGMIDEDSNLYGGIYKYFLNIAFECLPDNFTYADEIKNHPPHFFSHLFTLASCV